MAGFVLFSMLIHSSYLARYGQFCMVPTYRQALHGSWYGFASVYAKPFPFYPYTEIWLIRWGVSAQERTLFLVTLTCALAFFSKEGSTYKLLVLELRGSPLFSSFLWQSCLPGMAGLLSLSPFFTLWEVKKGTKSFL